MSSLKVKGAPFTLGGRTFELVFSLNVFNEIYEKYESTAAFMKEFNQAISDKKKPMRMVKVLKWVLCVLVNDSIEEQNERTNDKLDLLTEHQVGRLLTQKDFLPLQMAIIEAWKKSNPPIKSEGDEEIIPEQEDIEEDADSAKN